MSVPNAGKRESFDFVNVFAEGDKGAPSHKFYDKWTSQSSAAHSTAELFAADKLKELYPSHSLVSTIDWNLNTLGYPGALVEPLELTPLLTNVFFIPLARKSSPVPGILLESVQFGGFNVTWQDYEFIVYVITFPRGLGMQSQTFILHEGPEDPARYFLIAIGVWGQELHSEILVYNQYWRKDAGLWADVQKASWDDVILDDEFKESLIKDVHGFFTSETIYKDLSIPWKRGLILYGPPGNGKTISIKAIMKECDALGYNPLYVKSFQGWQGEEVAMAEVFDKARQLAPCVLVLEDLDSLINDRNRSFFLNQLDGLQGNDGLLVISTTNHFDRLDPGLSSRPSRFDRKYLFNDPNEADRTLYAQYWQEKLKSNKEILFPDSLVKEVAQATTKFSFAYLKEAFVATLVTLAVYEGKDKPVFRDTLLGQIKALRKQLSEQEGLIRRQTIATSTTQPSSSDNGRSIRDLLDALSSSAGRGNSRLETEAKDIRALMDALSKTLTTSSMQPSQMHGTSHSQRHFTNLQLSQGGSMANHSEYKAILDRISSQEGVASGILHHSNFPH